MARGIVQQRSLLVEGILSGRRSGVELLETTRDKEGEASGIGQGCRTVSGGLVRCGLQYKPHFLVVFKLPQELVSEIDGGHSKRGSRTRYWKFSKLHANGLQIQCSKFRVVAIIHLRGGSTEDQESCRPVFLWTEISSLGCRRIFRLATYRRL